MDEHKQDVLPPETIDESVKVVVTDIPAYRIGDADIQQQTSETSNGGKKGSGKKRTGHQKGLGRHSKMKKPFGYAEMPTLAVYVNQMLEKENKLLRAEEEIKKLKAELEQMTGKKKKQGQDVS